MKNTGTKFKEIAVEAARLGDSKHAENIVIYELPEDSSLADYAVLMSADSVPQLEAVEDAVSKAFKALFPPTDSLSQLSNGKNSQKHQPHSPQCSQSRWLPQISFHQNRMKQ